MPDALPDDALPEHAWLVVVDAQAVFADPDSPWGSPMWADAVGAVKELCEAYSGRVVLTRFVAAASPQGSWVPYYGQWPFALVPDADPLYAVVPEVAEAAAGAPVVTEPTFGKWGRQLEEVVGSRPTLVLAGVATDCCVISTALAAADAGATVVVAADACAGSTPENHAKALDVMDLYAPLVTVVRSG